MRRSFPALLVLITLSLLCTKALGLMFPFSKERIETIEYCVHGYEGNFGATGVYYKGDAAAFNETIAKLAKDEAELPDGQRYASKTIVIHPGPMTVPAYLADDKTIVTDWVIYVGRDVGGVNVQIDVYVGGNIKLDDIKIPEGFKVESGGEIEAFVQRHNKTKE